jgi:hypothetical protein
MSPEAEHESSLAERIEVVKKNFIRMLHSFLYNKNQECFNSRQENNRIVASLRLIVEKKNLKIYVTRRWGCEESPTLKFGYNEDDYKGQQGFTFPLSEDEANNLQKNINLPDYQTICEYGINESIVFLRNAINELTAEIEEKSAKCESMQAIWENKDIQAALHMKDVFESELREIEAFLERLQRKPETNWKEKILVYVEPAEAR